MYDMQYDAIDLVHSGMTLEQFKTMLESINVSVILEKQIAQSLPPETQCFIPVIHNGIVVGGDYFSANL